MKYRLLAATQRSNGLSLEAVLRSLEFDSSAFEDLAWWIGQDRAQALRIVRLVREDQREPFSGLGKPEPLKHELLGAGRGGSTRNTGWSIGPSG